MKSSILAALFTAAAVSAHGTMSTFIANGQTYKGPLSGGAADGPIRPISTVEPVMDVGSEAYGCGPGSAPGSGVAEVSAGSEVEFQMRNGDGGTWVHVKGPVIHSIYQCPSGAASCNPGNDAGWAIINNGGLDGGDWQMAKFGKPENVKVKIPSGTPNGEYLIRQELLALHNGHESYIQCVQIKVTGGPNGTLKDAGAQLLAYPGTLTGSEPGFSFNVYGTDISTYQFPGPAPFTAEGSAAPPPSDNTEPTTPPKTQCPAGKRRRAAVPVYPSASRI